MDLNKQENIHIENDEDIKNEKYNLIKNIFINLNKLIRLYSEESDNNMSLVINNSNNPDLQEYYQKKTSKLSNISINIKELKYNLKKKLLSILYDDNNFDLIKFIKEQKN